MSVLKEFPEDKILGVGCIDVQSHEVEKPEDVAATIRQILAYIPVDRVYANPDCGLNHLPRDVAFGKLQALVEGVKLVHC